MGDAIAPKVSVVVAVYNAEKYLSQCLESILGQTLRNIEVLCVNDGSTDGSAEILERFAANDNRVQVFYKENEGMGGAPARNFGLERARGEYVSVLDSDDFFELDMLEKAVARAETTGADMVVFGGYEYDDINGNVYKVSSILNEEVIPNKELFSYRDCPDDIFQLSQGMAWNKLYRREFLERTGLRFQKIKFTDDAYFTFAHMVLAEKITVLREFLCYYRVNSGSSQTDGLNHYPDSAYLPYVAVKHSLVEWGAYETVKRSFVNCAAAFLRYFYDKITAYEPFSYLHEKYRSEIFDFLNISGQEKSYFYDERVYLWTRQVMENSSGEILLKAARAYGSPVTTGILRFQFPYQLIPQRSRIAIVGAGIMGRHFYAQLMLSGYCDVVCWAEWENPFQLTYINAYGALKEAEFDYVLIAYMQPRLIKRAVDFLNAIGVPETKIIYGGEIT